MAKNTIKYNKTGSESDSIFKGNWAIRTLGHGAGPTNSSGFYSVVKPPRAGYTVYSPGPSGPSINVANNDTELLQIIAKHGGDSSSVQNALTWTAGQTNFLIANRDYESIVTNGLVLNLDAGYTASMPKGNSTWYDLVRTNNASLVSGTSYSTEKGGTLTFDGSDDIVTFSAPNLSGVATVEMWCKITSGYDGKMFVGWMYYDVYCAAGTIGYNTGNGDVYGISKATVDSLRIVDEWAHFVFEFRSDVSYTENKIYINGVKQNLSQQMSSESAGNRGFNGGNGRIASWGGGGYNMPMTLGSFRVYNRSLEASEVLKNYNAQKGRYVNFMPNGNFKFGNYNFSGATANTSTVLPGNSNSLQMPTSHYATFMSDQLIEVDTSKTYKMTVVNRTLTKGGSGNNILSGGHTGFACFDSSYRFIDLRNCGGIANTVLTRDLRPGDEYAYVSNQNNQWHAPNSLWYFRHFCLYPPTHPEYSRPWEYTRIGYGDYNILYNEITDIGGGELRMRFADTSNNWTTFPNIGVATPAGTPVMNGVAGGTYNYVFYPTEGAFGSWSTHESPEFTGENRNSHYPFRYATKYINFLHLINYAVPGGTTPLPVMLFGDIKFELLD